MNQLAFAQLMILMWLGSEAFVFARDWGGASGERRDRGSRAAVIVAVIAALGIAFLALRTRLAPLPLDLRLWQVAGLALFMVGLLMRQRAVVWLGEYFRTQVTLLEQHRLITSGPYARVRHPSYTAILISCAGFGLALADGVALAAMVVLPALALLYRIRVEEGALADHFGAEWEQYRGRTHALLAGLW